MPALLLLLGHESFGTSSNLRHLCAIIAPGHNDFFCYDWREVGGWNLIFALGIVLGGFLGMVVFRNPEPVALSARRQVSLTFHHVP